MIPLLALRYPLPVDWHEARGDLLAELSLLLSFTLGLLRLEVDVPYALHRGIASPRSLHPTELYLWLGRPALGAAAGLYRYQPWAHALAYVGAEGPGGREYGDLAILVGTDLRRLEPIYGGLAIRLATLEAGAAGAMLERIAGALGWRYRLQTLGTAADTPHSNGPLFYALERLPGEAPLNLGAGAALRQQILQRNSGAEFRGFALAERPLTLDLLRPALAGALAVPGLALYLLARRVTGLRAGLYRVESAESFRRIAGLRTLIPHSGIRESAIPAQLFLTSIDGQAANLRAGEAAHAIALALGGALACRQSLTFDAARWSAVVGADRPALLSCLVGWNRFRPYTYNLSL